MKKLFTLLCGTLLLGSAWATGAEPAKLETVWNHSVNNGDTKPAYILTYAWNASQRSIAYYNDKVYITNNQPTVDYITVVNAKTGLFEKNLSLGAGYGSQTGWMKNNIAITEDGFAIIGSSGSGGTYMTFQVIDLKTEEVKVLARQVNTPGITRADYFAVQGKYESAESEGAYITFASTAGNIVRIPMFGGEIKTDNVQIETSTYATAAAPGTSAMGILNKDASGMYIVARSINSGYYDFSLKTFTPIATTLVPIGTNSGGVCFEIAGKEYLVAAADNISQFTILDVTNGVGTATEVIKSLDLLGAHSVAASSAITPMAVQVTADAAIIYVYSTNNGIAAYQFTPEKAEVKIVADPIFNPEGGAFNDQVLVEITCATGGAKIYYTIDGTEPTAASTEYTGTITLNKATTVKAIAILEGYTSSAVVSETYDVTTGINEGTVRATQVYPSNDAIVVKTDLVGSTVEVYNLQGQKVLVKIATGDDELALTKGIYVVKVGKDIFKVIL